MASLSDKTHDAIHCPSTKLLAETLWHLLKADHMMEAQCYLRTETGIFKKYTRALYEIAEDIYSNAGEHPWPASHSRPPSSHHLRFRSGRARPTARPGL